MSTRLVITVSLGEDVKGGPDLAAIITGLVIPDLEGVAGSVSAEIEELRAGQYGWTSDPDTHDVRLHWAIKQEES